MIDMNYLAIILAILPILLVGILYYLRDTLKEPKKVLGSMFCFGLISALLVIAISFISLLIFPSYLDVENASYLKIFIYSFIFTSLVEEGCKWIMVYKIAFKSQEFDQLYDIVLYSVFVGLGFATIENLIYIVPSVYGVWIAMFRAITAIPAHTCFGTFIGYYLAMYKKFNQKRYLIMSLLVPVLLHGLYDFLLYSENIYMAAIFLILITGMLIVTIIKVNKIVKFDKEMLKEKRS